MYNLTENIDDKFSLKRYKSDETDRDNSYCSEHKRDAMKVMKEL